MTDTRTTYLSTGEVVAHLHDRGMRVSAETVRRWATSGRLRSIRTPGGQRRFRVDDVDAMLAPVEAGAVA